MLEGAPRPGSSQAEEVSGGVSDIFIRRPIATSLLMVGLLLVGLAGYQLLPVAALPQVDYPTIVVATALPGASPETMASAVTTPLERWFGQMPSLNQMNSVSSFSNSSITLQFDLQRDIDAAEQDVQAAINSATTFLPATLPTPPTYSKSNPADAAILTLSVSSDSLPLSQVDDYADSVLAQKISQVTGVGLVTLGGGQKPAVRVQVDPQAIAALGLGLEDVRSLLGQANVDAPKGSLDGRRQAYTLVADDQLFKAAAYRPLILASSKGVPLRLSDVADVVDGVENAKLAAWAGFGAGAAPPADASQKRAILLNIQRQPGANIIQVANRVKALLPKLAASIPPAIKVDFLSDRTETIRASVADVQFSLLLSIALVVLVVFFFLRNVWATVIPSVAVPLSLVGTFGVMYLLGYSLDNLSLMALTISTGFVVDDAIVMIENISRYLEKGETPLRAALLGAKQIGFTIISLTVSLVAVLIPLLFMGGVIGRLFREFAVTLSVAILVSALLSLSLTPMMCAQLLKAESDAAGEHGRLWHLSERFHVGMLRFYERTLKVVLRHQRTTLLVTLGTFVFTLALFWVIPKGFFPVQDTGLLLGISQAAPDISFPQMQERQAELADALLKDPDVATIASFIGADGTNPTANSGRLSISLKPREARRHTLKQTLRNLEAAAGGVLGIKLFLQPVQDLSVDNKISRTQYQVTFEDADPVELAAWVPKVVDRLASLPQLRDVGSDLEQRGLAATLKIDRDSASRLGVTPQAIDDTLYDAFGQRQVSNIYTQLNQYRVILEVKPEFQQQGRALDSLYVKSTSGAQIPLSAFTTLTETAAPLAINHQGQFPAATVSFNLNGNASLGQAVSAIREAQAAIGLPDSVHAEFGGTAQEFNSSLSSEPLLILAALITVYIVLGVLYESYIHPITILSTLPSAGVGALLALMITGQEFTIIALIGIILLIGIVKKNAIMMIDFALEAERKEGLPPEESIFQACILRFRPIMMTTLAALLGGVPLAFGSGTGAELRRPLGISIVGGLILSQLLTLYTTPVIYLAMERLSARFTRRRSPAEPAEAGASSGALPATAR